MQLKEQLSNTVLFLDGGTGTQLQARGLQPGELPELWNLERRQDLIAIHRAYYEAGADVVMSNTFGANRLKLHDCPYSVPELVTAAIENLRAARDQAGHGWLGLDIGPTGRLLAPLGDLDFETAYDSFRETILAGAAAGADVVVIETMTDLYELKAAVLAAKEACSLPVFATVAFNEQGKLLTGGDPAALTALLEGLGVDALGANCGTGPIQLARTARTLLEYATVPVILKPNAGLPRSEGGLFHYDIDENEFAAAVSDMIKAGVAVAGGCCGTTPGHIEALHARCNGISLSIPRHAPHTLVSSYAKALDLRGETVPIGTVSAADPEDAVDEAFAAQDDGAQLLRITCADPIALTGVVREVQAVLNLPLWLDTADADALASALRRYNGKAMVTVDEETDAILPLLHRYGGVAVCHLRGDAPQCRGAAQTFLSALEAHGLKRQDALFFAPSHAAEALKRSLESPVLPL